MIEKITIGTISAVVHSPEKQSDTLVILLPGYLDSKDFDHLVMLADDLKNKGYTAVRVDLTGTWESGDDLSKYTVSRHLEDLQEVLEHMFSTHAYTRVFLGGHSRGGFLSVLYAMKDERISGAFAIMSPYVLLRKGSEEKMKKWKERGFRAVLVDVPGSSEKKELRMPYVEENIKDAQKHNLLEEIHTLHKPLLLIAGEEDDLITPKHVRELYEKANEPKKFVVIEGVDHDYRLRKEEIEKVNKEVLAWLDENH